MSEVLKRQDRVRRRFPPAGFRNLHATGCTRDERFPPGGVRTRRNAEGVGTAPGTARDTHTHTQMYPAGDERTNGFLLPD